MNVVREIIERIQGKAPKGAKRSSSWRRYRRHYMDAHPICAVCGRRNGLEAHHIIPFHIAPDLELTKGNLMALCRRCHLFVGHLGAWHRFNVLIKTDAAYWRSRFVG